MGKTCTFGAMYALERRDRRISRAELFVRCRTFSVREYIFKIAVCLGTVPCGMICDSDGAGVVAATGFAAAGFGVTPGVNVGVGVGVGVATIGGGRGDACGGDSCFVGDSSLVGAGRAVGMNVPGGGFPA